MSIINKGPKGEVVHNFRVTHHFLHHPQPVPLYLGPGRNSEAGLRVPDLRIVWSGGLVIIYVQSVIGTYPGECLLGKGGYYGFGKLGHRIKECPYAKQGSRDIYLQTLAISSSTRLPSPFVGCIIQHRWQSAPKSIPWFASPDVVTSIRHTFYLDMYVLLDLGSNISYVTPPVAVKS